MRGLANPSLDFHTAFKGSTPGVEFQTLGYTHSDSVVLGVPPGALYLGRGELEEASPFLVDRD